MASLLFTGDSKASRSPPSLAYFSLLSFSRSSSSQCVSPNVVTGKVQKTSECEAIPRNEFMEPRACFKVSLTFTTTDRR